MCMLSFFIAVTDRAENLDLLSQQLKKKADLTDGTRVATVTCFAFFRIVLMFKPVSSKDCKSENSLCLKI